MMKKTVKKANESLLAERKERAKNTNKKLHQALDRFENNCLEVVPINSKLSLHNLAIEASVNKDTPFSRYKKGSISEGKYRFPEIVTRFEEIKVKIDTRNKKSSPQNQIKELRHTIRDYEQKFIQQARIANQQDQRIIELEEKCKDLESKIEKIKVLKYKN